MRRPRPLAVGAAAAVVSAMLAAGAALGAPPGAKASLPTVSSGARPGPPLLYSRPPQAPQLDNRAPFRARPLLVSGTDAYRDGEYLYQDYLFDDRGADTVEGSGGQRDSNANFSSTSGNVFYPTADHYGHNAADLVELRIRPTPDAIVYRATLNTVKDGNAAIVGIGIDRDRSGGRAVPWPSGAGVASPGLDHFVTAWGTGARVFRRDPSTGDLEPMASLGENRVSISRRSNQMTIRIPRSLMDPGQATWRYVAGVGLHAGGGRFQAVRLGSATSNEPGSGDPTEGAPAVFNLAFRFDEPQTSRPSPGTGPGIGIGNWFESKQAAVLKRPLLPGPPSTSNFRADVNFARLAQGADGFAHRPGRNQARILASALRLHEGFRDRFPAYGGPLQPYMLRVPPARPGERRGLTWSLHSLGGTYTQYPVFSPRLLEQLGDERGHLLATPLGRGANGWYMDEAEVDFFEVWRDIAQHFRLDPRRVGLNGYSMGGYGTYRLGAFYPDLFGRAFTAVGPPARGGWIPPAAPFDPDAGRMTQFTNSNALLESVRWVPYLNWAAIQDELVPYLGVRAQLRRFDRLRLRSQLWSFPGEHFTLAVRDEWAAAKRFLGDAPVERTPSRVTYALMPASNREDLGLVHSHAYWVSGLSARDRSGDPGTDPARAEIDAYSRAFGEGREPRTAPVTSANLGPPLPSSVEGTRWTGIPRVPFANALSVRLENLARAVIDGRRARLDGDRRLRVELASDGPGRLRLNLPLPAGARAVRIQGTAAPGDGPEVTVDRGGATFRVDGGHRTYLIIPG